MTRFRPRALTSRLVALVVVLLVFSLLAVGVSSTVALRSYLVKRLDQQLAAAGVRYSLSLEHPSDGDDDNDDQTFASTVGQAAGTLGARAINGTVTSIGVVAPSEDHPEPTPADRQTLAGLHVSAHPHTVQLPDLGSYRLSVVSGRDGDVLITGLPMRDVDEPVQHVIAVEAVVFAAVIAVAALIGLGVIRRALGPLSRIAGAARGVTDLHLSSGSVQLPEALANPRPGTEVGDVTEAFNLMLAHVQHALEQRHADEGQLRSFIADASHELRTPVAVIASHAEYAQRESDDDPAAVDHALERIRAESARMGHLVDDLLLLARLDLEPTLALEPVDLSRVVLDAVADASRIAPEHHWALELPEDPITVTGNAHALHQCVANLLSNARSHTPPGTTVQVSVAMRPGGVRLEVRDDGPGIPAEVLPHVLERFSRAEQSRGRTDGAGLGLAIVDAIVRAHHGVLTITSAPGDTTVVIDLPT